MSQLNCSFRLCVVWIVMRSFRASSFCHDLWIWAHLTLCHVKGSADAEASVSSPDIQNCSFSLHPFILSSIIPTSFSSVLAGFSLPLHVECYLRVCQTAKFWSSTITVLGLFTEVGILLIWNPLAINLGQLITAVQLHFSINLYLALKAMCFWASPLLFLSASPLDTSTGL